MRIRTICSGPERDEMAHALGEIFTRQFEFRFRDGIYFRSAPLDDTQIRDLFEEVWDVQIQYGPKTNLWEIILWEGVSVRILITKREVH